MTITRNGAPVAGSRLMVEGVSVRFGGVRALDSVDLAVQPGETVSLIGPNGAGKTTLFNVISGFLEPQEGTATFERKDLAGLSAFERSRLGMVRTFQRMELYEELTVLENLVVTRELQRPPAVVRGLFQGDGSREGDVADAQELLAVLDLSPVAHHKVSELPTGLRRLVELGRALMGEARLLLLDEPSSGLDQAETERFMGILLGLRAQDRDHSVLLVEHDMTVALGLADYVYVLDFGRLIAEGTPEAIRADERVHAAYLGQELAT